MEFPDYSVFEITQGDEKVRVLIGVVDTVTVTCGSQSSINFLEFLWDNTLIFLSSSTELSAFHSSHLRSSTFDIIGLLVGAGRRVPYAHRVS